MKKHISGGEETPAPDHMKRTVGTCYAETDKKS